MKARSPRSGSEAAFAAWWAAGRVAGHDLPTRDGRTARILFPGRPGGPVGPDFRDAVILLDGIRRAGDIELHLRASGWNAHRHQTDPRYDRVILHVVAGGPAPPDPVIRLASGATAPIVILDNPAQFAQPSPHRPIWPCRAHPLPAPELANALRAWGQERFAARVARFRAELAAIADPAAALDTVLLAAITEALGYGRAAPAPRPPPHPADREGEIVWADTGVELCDQPAKRSRLPGFAEEGPEVGRDRLSLRRFSSLNVLADGWRMMSPGAIWCGAALAGGTAEGWMRLMRLFIPAGNAIGRNRSAIVLWNAVLPVLVAHGQCCGNVALARVAQEIAETAPGLPGNAITRWMARWLGLRHAPPGALAQQGLHHLHAQWCREKSCAGCPAHQMRQA